MKTYLFATLLILSLSTMASETCYKVSKQGADLGSICMDKNLGEVKIGESVEINGTIDTIIIDFKYVRLQDQQYQACNRPKDRPPVCKLMTTASLILPNPPLNKIGLPSVPSNIIFNLPDLSTGETWGYKLSLIEN